MIRPDLLGSSGSRRASSSSTIVVKCGANRWLALPGEDERSLRSLGGLFSCDDAALNETVEHVALTGTCGGDPLRVAIDGGKLKEACQVARLRQVEMPCTDAEMEPRRRRDAVGAASVVDVVEVALEQVAFGVACLELECDQRLAGLAHERRRAVVGQIEAPRELLGDRRSTARPGLVHRRIGQRAGDGERVDPGVRPEAMVLCRDGGQHGERRDVLECHRYAQTSRRVPGQGRSVAVNDERPGGRLLLAEWRQWGEVGICRKRPARTEGNRRCRQTSPDERADPVAPQQRGGPHRQALAIRSLLPTTSVIFRS